MKATISEDPVDDVVFDPFTGYEDDDLADQAEGDDLNAEHDQQHTENQGRPIRQRDAQEQAGERQPAGVGEADQQDREPEQAEEPQRRLDELQHHVQGENVEDDAQAPKPAEVRTHTRRFGAARSNADLAHAKAPFARHQRQEVRLETVADELAQHFATAGPHPTQQVVEGMAEQRPEQHVKCGCLQARRDRAAGLGPAPADRHVVPIEFGDDAAQVRGIDLAVGRQHENDVAACMPEAAPQRLRFARPASKDHNLQPLIAGAERGEVGERRRRLLADHVNQLVGQANTRNGVTIGLIDLGNVGAIPNQRNDRRQPLRRGWRCTFGRRTGVGTAERIELC